MKTFLCLVGDIVAVVALPRESEGGHDNIALSSGRRERERGRGGTHSRALAPARFISYSEIPTLPRDPVERQTQKVLLLRVY